MKKLVSLFFICVSFVVADDVRLPAPVLRLEGDQISLTYKAESGYGYRLQQSTDLKNWVNVGADIRGEGALSSHSIAASSDDSVFYTYMRYEVYSPWGMDVTELESLLIEEGMTGSIEVDRFSENGDAEGTYQIVDASQGLEVIIDGEWSCVCNPSDLNQLTVTFDIRWVSVTGHFSGSPKDFYSSYGEAIPTRNEMEYYYTSLDHGTMTEKTYLADGTVEESAEEAF